MSSKLPDFSQTSNLLDRLKSFMPEMEKANKDLEQKILTEGADSVRIDKHMSPDNEEDQVVVQEGNDERVVQLSFALGDFDNTPLAQAEEEKEKEKEGTEVQGEVQFISKDDLVEDDEEEL